MVERIAFISQGRLYVKGGEAEPHLLESDFALEAAARSIQLQQKKAWKMQGGSALIPGSALWGTSLDAGSVPRMNFAGVCRGSAPGEILYALTTNAVGGMFAYNAAERKETRLFHREGLWLRDLDRSEEEGLIACSQQLPNGTACIGICRGAEFQQVTEGDSVDEAPSWVPGGNKQIVFQSAGIGRNAQGHVVGLGPFSIQRLSLVTGEMTSLLENDRYDYLLPHVLPDGSLVVIRRPYEPPGRLNYPFHKMLLDVVLFPFRVARALFHLLNFISMAFSKKPLATTLGPPVESLIDRHIVLRWRMIDAQRALKQASEAGQAPSLVPDSWQLLRRGPTGEESVLASSVAAFDVDSHGTVVYTNGTAIFVLDGEGKSRQIAKGALIDTVVCLD
ncbi:MAG TPA: hypothetical protein V6D08_08820 [Candidatus Obscuribacterales bacterium]